jgi:hypothetical protein
MRAVSVSWRQWSGVAWPRTLNLRHGCSDNERVSGDCCRECLRHISRKSQDTREIRYRLSPCVYVRDRFPRIPSVNSEHKYAGLAKHNPELYPHTQKGLGPKKTSRDIVYVMAIMRDAMQSVNLCNGQLRDQG